MNNKIASMSKSEQMGLSVQKHELRLSDRGLKFSALFSLNSSMKLTFVIPSTKPNVYILQTRCTLVQRGSTGKRALLFDLLYLPETLLHIIDCKDANIDISLLKRICRRRDE